MEEYHIGTSKTMLARMSAKRGFPCRQLYRKVAGMIGNGKYTLISNAHTYFGHRKNTILFEKERWAYVYVDKVNAVLNSAKWIMAHRDEYDRMGMAEKTWTEVSFGYWNATTISGKIQLDIIDLIIYLQLRKRMAGMETSVTEMLGNAQAWMCHLDTKETKNINTISQLLVNL